VATVTPQHPQYSSIPQSKTGKHKYQIRVNITIGDLITQVLINNTNFGFQNNTTAITRFRTNVTPIQLLGKIQLIIESTDFMYRV